jgi:hypothetical protein
MPAGRWSDLVTAVSCINSQSLLEGRWAVDIYTEMKFTIEQRVFIVETFAKEKLTGNVSASFVVNVLTHQFPQSRMYPSW